MAGDQSFTKASTTQGPRLKPQRGCFELSREASYTSLVPLVVLQESRIKTLVELLEALNVDIWLTNEQHGT